MKLDKFVTKTYAKFLETYRPLVGREQLVIISQSNRPLQLKQEGYAALMSEFSDDEELVAACKRLIREDNLTLHLESTEQTESTISWQDKIEENTFYEIGNPFEPCEFVILDCGSLHTKKPKIVGLLSPYHLSTGASEFCSDASDMALTMYFIHEKGELTHNHPYPWELDIMEEELPENSINLMRLKEEFTGVKPLTSEEWDELDPIHFLVRPEEIQLIEETERNE